MKEEQNQFTETLEERSNRLERTKRTLPAAIAEHLGVKPPSNRKQRRARHKLIRAHKTERFTELNKRLDEGRLIVADLGKNNAHFYNAKTKEEYKVSLSDLASLDLPGLQAGYVIVFEEAHYRSRGETSKAQAFEHHQLLQLFHAAIEKDVILYMFPQCNTPKARGFALGTTAKPKEDIDDCKSIADTVLNRRKMASLREFIPISMDEYKSISADWIADLQKLNEDCNLLRNRDYCYREKDSQFFKLIKGCAEYLAPRLTATQLQLMNFSFGKKGLLVDPYKWYNKVVYIAMTLIGLDEEEQIVMRYRTLTVKGEKVQKPPTWKYVQQRFFGFSPYHFKAGITASNLKMHMLQKHSLFKIVRPKVDPNRKDSPRVPWTDETHAQLEDSRKRFRDDVHVIWTLMKEYLTAELAFQSPAADHPVKPLQTA